MIDGGRLVDRAAAPVSDDGTDNDIRRDQQQRTCREGGVRPVAPASEMVGDHEQSRHG